MSSNNNNEAINIACIAFHKSVTKLISKIHKSKHTKGTFHNETDIELQQQATQLVNHANHVLVTLVDKRQSLEFGIVTFKELSDLYVQQFKTTINSNNCNSSNANNIQKRQRDILTNWFATFIRLRDGFVLLESGECRHTHDIDDSKYPSQLSGALRSDGQTRKFKSINGYAGYGWDEVNDEDVGIKSRLLDTFYDIDGTKGRGFMKKQFDKDGSGAQLYEQQLDIVNDTSGIRDEFMSAAEQFVSKLNVHLSSVKSTTTNGGSKKDVLKLVTDDKSERMTWGSLDIARQGNAFTLSDKGGSLPIGMTVDKWRDKFGLSSSVEVEKPADKKKFDKKKRKVILEDSSEEEWEDDEVKAASKPKAVKEVAPTTTQSSQSANGLAVRVRKATDVSNRKGVKTTSVEEMKRQLGVNTAELESGHDQLEEEQLKSKMAADDEDIQEGLLGDNQSVVSTYDPLLKACFSSRKELRKNELYTNDIELLREGQEYWTDFDSSAAHWKEQFQALRVVRKDIGSGELNDSSDHAYNIRDDFREANMTLGNDCMEIHSFFSGQLDKYQQQPDSLSSSLVDSLAKVCHSYLRLAEETYKTALNLVLEHERCQATSTMSIDTNWEKGQHLFLRGRAQYNIGYAMYELALFNDSLPTTQQQRKYNTKDLLIKAKMEFNNALQRAKSLRQNAVLIYGHADANVMSNQSSHTWRTEAIIHTLEGMKLEVNASGLHIACSLKLNDTKEVNERFGSVCGSVELTDILQFTSIEGIAHVEIAELFGEVYWMAMSVAESTTRKLESMTASNRQGGLDTKTGDTLLQIIRTAMKRASSVSDQLLSFVEQHSVDDYAKEHIATSTNISKEGDAICKWWGVSKAQAHKRLSEVVQVSRAATSVVSTLPRSGISGDVGTTTATIPPTQRRIFNQDASRALNGISNVVRTRRVKKKKSSEGQVLADSFSAEFNPDSDINNTTTNTSGGVLHAVEARQKPEYCKWGNDVMEEKERKRSCPPLPKNLVELGVSIDLIRALEKKLGNTLPADYLPIDEYRRGLVN